MVTASLTACLNAGDEGEQAATTWRSTDSNSPGMTTIASAAFAAATGTAIRRTPASSETILFTALSWPARAAMRAPQNRVAGVPGSS
jgi:hypothetical protein